MEKTIKLHSFWGDSGYSSISLESLSIEDAHPKRYFCTNSDGIKVEITYQGALCVLINELYYLKNIKKDTQEIISLMHFFPDEFKELNKRLKDEGIEVNLEVKIEDLLNLIDAPKIE